MATLPNGLEQKVKELEKKVAALGQKLTNEIADVERLTESRWMPWPSGTAPEPLGPVSGATKDFKKDGLRFVPNLAVVHMISIRPGGVEPYGGDIDAFVILPQTQEVVNASMGYVTIPKTVAKGNNKGLGHDISMRLDGTKITIVHNLPPDYRPAFNIRFLPQTNLKP